MQPHTHFHLQELQHAKTRVCNDTVYVHVTLVFILVSLMSFHTYLDEV